MSTLVNYLKNLNSQETQWGVWVNPENTDEYRVGQFCFENGGLLDDWICIGSLDKLSFGFQSQSDAIKALLTNHKTRYKAGIEYKGREVRVNLDAIMDAWSNGNLNSEFGSFLEKRAKEIELQWAELEAEDFVYNKLPAIISEVLKSREEAAFIC